MENTRGIETDEVEDGTAKKVDEDGNNRDAAVHSQPCVVSEAADWLGCYTCVDDGRVRRQAAGPKRRRRKA